MKTLIYLYLFLSSFAVTFALVPLVRRMALRFEVLDHPGARKVHASPKPRLGGLAIYGSVVAVIATNTALMFLLKSNPLLIRTFPFVPKQIPLFLNVTEELVALLVSSTIVLIFGILDDVKGIDFSYRIKLLGQFAAAGVVIYGGARVTFLPHPFLNCAVTALWIVLITNSFNLLDNMDGLSAGVAVISSLILASVTGSQGQFFSAVILFVVAGSIAGFLPYNFYPSSIFMGDTGSQFIGFLIGTLTVTSSYVTDLSTSLMPIVLPVLVLSVPLFDTFSVILIRLQEGRSVFRGDTSHFSHRLVELGMSQRGAVLFIYAICFCVGIAATLLPSLPIWGSLVVLVQAVIIYSLVTTLMLIGKRSS